MVWLQCIRWLFGINSIDTHTHTVTVTNLTILSSHLTSFLFLSYNQSNKIESCSVPMEPST